MPTSTSFLSLTLPELNEFVDSWNSPVNGNFEVLDDWTSDLFASLMTGSATATWAALRGDLPSLVQRLNVSLNADGTIKLSGSSDYSSLANSAVHGQYSDPRKRLDAGDFLRHEANQPVADGRFAPMLSTGPSAGFPPEGLDAGVALRSADFGYDATHPISSPRKPWAPGLVTGGQTAFITTPGPAATVRFTGSSSPAVFNIDGYIFRLREIIDMDYSVIAPGNGDHIWFYVDRNDANYGVDGFLYDGVGGAGTAAKDLRVLQSGTGGGTTLAGVFEDGGALFNTAVMGKVKSGDVLVIEGGSAIGSYVIDVVNSDININIKGTFPAIVGGANWHIQDNAHPNFGAAKTDTDASTQPPAVAGRVYIGRAIHSGGIPTSEVTFLSSPRR
jgi:hypothetical protein